MANQAKIEFTGDSSKLATEVTRSEHMVRSFGTGVRNTFANVNRYIDAATQHFGFFGTAVAAFTSGAVLKKLFSPSDYIPIDNALLMMQMNLKMTAKELGGFKKELAGLSGEKGVDIDLIFGKAAKLSRGYKPEDIKSIISEGLRGAEATSQDPGAFIDTVVKIMKMYNKGADDAKDIANSLIASRVNIEQLGTILDRGVIRGGAGKEYEEIVAILGALGKAGVDSTRAVASLENILTTIQDKTLNLKASGIELFKIDPKTGEKTKKSIVEIVNELGAKIDEATKKGVALQRIKEDFDKALSGGSYEAVKFLLNHLGIIQQELEKKGRKAEIAAEMGITADEKWEKALGRIREHLKGMKTDLEGVYNVAKRPVKFLAESPNLVKSAGWGAAFGALTIGGYVISKKGMGFLKSIGSTAAGVAEGKALESAAGITPVFVTGGTLNNVSSVPGISSSISTLGAVLPLAIGTAVVAAFLSHASDPEVKKESETRAAQARVAEARVRRMTEEYLSTAKETRRSGASKIVETMDLETGKVSKTTERPAITNEITINMEIDKSGQTVVQSSDPKTRLDVKRGGFFPNGR